MRNVLVTGATGTFGNAFVKHLLENTDAERIVIYSRDELKHLEMGQRLQNNRLRFFLGDVRDRDRLLLAFRGIDTVVHAAALKQVPAGEYDPSEFIKTNILGTENVLRAADQTGVSRVLCLSTDKAAAPLTLYGSTKSVVEHLTRAAQNYSQNCKFACLRYGNVAGSRGSVIPVWKEMIKNGASSLPVTSKDMTRFFFSIKDAVVFAQWALDTMVGGELFVPKMPSFYVTDLARAMEYTFEIVGIRGAEKIAEVMVAEEEARYFREVGSRYIRYPEGKEIGERLPDGFQYRSDTNASWLSVSDLKQMVSKI